MIEMGSPIEIFLEEKIMNVKFFIDSQDLFMRN